MGSPPERFGRYEVRATLGAGAMGTVYSGWDPELGRPVAIKILKPQYVGDEGLVRFRREAQTLAQLSHRHIVAIYDTGHADGHPFIVMELVQGRTLASEIEHRVERPLAQKIALAAQVCNALSFVHAAGVLHRDVKPGNILITDEPIAKLADFGLARLEHSSLTASANVVGTPAYLPPEAFAGETIDTRADVYGIAASLFEWLCGERPHEAEHLATLMARIVNHDALDIRKIWPECPPPLADCLKRGLARDRNDRFASADDFARALRAVNIIDAVPVQAGSTVLLQASLPRRPKRRVLLAAATGVAVALAALSWSAFPSSPVQAPPSSPAPSAPAAIEVRAFPLPAGAKTPLPTQKSATAEARTGGGITATAVPEARTAQDEGDEPEAASAAVPIGAKLLIAMRTELRTDRSRPGQLFEGELVEALTWNGREVVPASARVQGVIDTVVAGTDNRMPSLQLSLLSVSIHGQPVRIRTARYDVVAPPNAGESRALTLVISAAVGAAVGGAIGGTASAAGGAALGALVGGRPSPTGNEYVFGNRLTFKLAAPLPIQPGTD